jgi:hypothetical protein
VRILGPREVEGLRRPIRRQSVGRLLVCLAVAPERPRPAEELAAAIADDPDRQPKTASLHSYASLLRTGLPEAMLPDAAAGYQLDRARLHVDWLAYTDLTGQADRTDGAEATELRLAALALVRGRPLAGGRWEGIEAACRHIEATVESTAHTAARSLLDTGEAARAEWAISQGLRNLPESPRLWEDRLAAAAAGSGYGLERAWADAQTVLGADAGLIATTYQTLRRQTV